MMKIGLIGCGGMGTTHNLSLKALSKIIDIQVTAVADCRKAFLEKAASQWEDVESFETGMELLEKADIDVVHICLPSYLHTDHAIAAMERGFHTFIEKPVCLTETDCERLLEVEKRTGVKVIVGHVVRFFDEYKYLKKVYASQELGKLQTLTLQRLSGDTTWGYEDWFHDEKRSGSVVLDLHVHDVDFLRYLAGEPKSYQVTAEAFDSGMVHHINTTYEFDEITVRGEGLWDVSPSLPFEASFRAAFEQGTLVFNGKSEPKLSVYYKDGRVVHPELHSEYNVTDNSAGINISNLGPYYSEIKYFLECIIEDKPIVVAPLSEGVKSVKLALGELEAAKKYIG